MRVEIFTPVYNGMYILPFFIDHYMERFPGCRINIAVDSDTTDNSLSYSIERGCNAELVYFPFQKPETVNYYRNNCWKNSEAEWIIVVDQDELVDISLNDLERIKDYDVIKVKSYNMVGTDGETNPKNFTYGKKYQCTWYNKCLMFKKSIGEINYTLGAHSINPIQEYKLNKYRYTMYHYPKKMVSEEEFINHYIESVGYDHAYKMYIDEIKDLQKLR